MSVGRRSVLWTLVAALLILAGGCRVPGPTVSPEPTATSGLARAAEPACADLAARLAVPREAIRVVSVEPHTWPDTSLGLPEPGKAYAQVRTEGAIVTLRHEGDIYVYHVAGPTARLNPQRSAPLAGTTTPTPPARELIGIDIPLLLLPPAVLGYAWSEPSLCALTACPLRCWNIKVTARRWPASRSGPL